MRWPTTATTSSVREDPGLPSSLGKNAHGRSVSTPATSTPEPLGTMCRTFGQFIDRDDGRTTINDSQKSETA